MSKKKVILSTVLSATFLICTISTSVAESIATEGDVAFIADKGLVVKNISTGLEDQCLINNGFLDPDGNDVSAQLGSASDVVIVGSNAVITIHPLVDDTDPEGPTVTDMAIVDITSCLDVNASADVAACVATVDIEQGFLNIPCIETDDGSIFSVNMDQQGSSDNWRVTFLGENSELLDFKLDDEHRNRNRNRGREDNRSQGEDDNNDRGSDDNRDNNGRR